MRIGIDARPLTQNTFAGISNYEYQVVTSWMKNHPEHEYYLMARRKVCFKEADLPENWHIVNDPYVIDKQKLWFLFKLPKLIKELKLDVFWGPNYSLPKKVDGVRYYLSIHDLAIFKFKKIGQWKNALQIRLLLRSYISRANKIFAISESTKRDIVELFGVPKDRIKVTYLSGGDEKKEQDSKPEVRKDIADIDECFLFVGTIEPRKNILTIIHGYEKYCEGQSDPIPLVLAGGRGWNCDDIYEAVDRSSCRKHIFMPGYISDEEKEELFRKAKAFVYPSLYEGFGIPVIETFRRGVPVITANNSSLPEVGGDAAYYIDTYDDDKLAEYMGELVQINTVELNALREKMYEQAEKFSWERCAEETLREITA